MTVKEFLPLLEEDEIIQIYLDKIEFPRAKLVYDSGINNIEEIEYLNKYPIESISTNCYNPRPVYPNHVWRSYITIILNGDE